MPMENGIMLTPELFLQIVEVLAAIGAVFVVIFAVYKWYLRQNKQDEDIKALKKESSILCEGLLACLKGMAEHGYNGPVTKGIQTIEDYLNEQAHQ